MQRRTFLGLSAAAASLAAAGAFGGWTLLGPSGQPLLQQLGTETCHLTDLCSAVAMMPDHVLQPELQLLIAGRWSSGL